MKSQAEAATGAEPMEEDDVRESDDITEVAKMDVGEDDLETQEQGENFTRNIAGCRHHSCFI